MLRESGSHTLLFLQFFIALVTWSMVNDSASSRDIALHPSTPDESSSMKSACPASLEVVAILSAVFCVICSLLMFVCDARGDHMVETY